MSFCIHNIRAIDPVDGTVGSAVAIDAGKIVALEDRPAEGRLDGGGRLMTPGLIDLHTHGIERYMFEESPEQLKEGLSRLPRYGVTGVCPTCYVALRRDRLAELEALAEALDEVTDVHVPGFHFEGPFLALPGAGAITRPGDLGLLEELLAAMKGKVAIMSVSPDTENIIPVIERLVEHGVLVSMTHTRADWDQTKAAIDAGARHATHFYDVFHLPGPPDAGVRPVGSVEAILQDERCSVDFIPDGQHVHPGVIDIAVRCKGPESVVVISDANIGAGLPEGVYDTPWGFPVSVVPGKGARNAAKGHPNFGLLAGSASTMNELVNNLRNWLDLPEHQIWAMATANPARLLGMTNRGRLQPGAIADLVLWDEKNGQPEALATWHEGQLVWSSPDFDAAQTATQS